MEKEILEDEFDDPEFLEFAIENISELISYIATGRVNIRICRDITGLPPSERIHPGGRRAVWRVRYGLVRLLMKYQTKGIII